VKTIATYFKIGRQSFEDYSELQGLINSLGSYKINAEMDRQILTGSNTGEDLDGLITQATAFDTTLLNATAGYTYFDQIAAAAQQVGEADEFEPTFFVVHPRNWWQMKRLKDSQKQYLLDGPRGDGAAESIWGMTPVATTQITSGTFLVGSGTSPAVEFRPRMELEVMISAEDGDNFKENMYTVRFEARGLLAVYRPGSFITGTFLNSPAQS
jgi:HK97 family phage major capsid protein